MTTPNIRPHFDFEFQETPDAVMARLRERLPRCPRCTGVSKGSHAELFVPTSERKIWSPWLSVTAETDHYQTILRGRFAPHPSVWTWYLFCSFALAFGLLVGLSLAYAQWATETAPWGLVSIPICLLLGGMLFLASQIGQRLGADQMHHLKSALGELTEERNMKRATSNIQL